MSVCWVDEIYDEINFGGRLRSRVCCRSLRTSVIRYWSPTESPKSHAMTGWATRIWTRKFRIDRRRQQTAGSEFFLPVLDQPGRSRGSPHRRPEFPHRIRTKLPTTTRPLGSPPQCCPRARARRAAGCVLPVRQTVAGLIGKQTPDGTVIESDQDLVLYLLDEASVATIQGSALRRIAVLPCLLRHLRGCPRKGRGTDRRGSRNALS